ncbi:MAG TPA: ribosome-associated translation inhibitor RaiA [Succinivibrionaceae bacterium]|nr:ribosome-associated translation inhibitor RaiA [Succinivibrio sp.]HAR79242.1 ribosome-associated translation inhibitor RaiA [Succinivibrionaceae bacterium]
MQINIQGVGLKLTDSLKDYVNDKFKRLERKGDLITSLNVTLTVDKLSHIAKADLAVAGGNLHAEATAEDMYPAIDALIDKVDRQLVKYKEKLKKE